MSSSSIFNFSSILGDDSNVGFEDVTIEKNILNKSKSYHLQLSPVTVFDDRDFF